MEIVIFRYAPMAEEKSRYVKRFYERISTSAAEKNELKTKM